MFSFRSKGVLRLLCLLVAAAALLAGCAGELTPADDRPETSASDAAEPSAGEVGAGEPESGSVAETAFSYNAHWRSDVLSDLVTPSEWESVHRMVDAIYAGEDTFESASEEAYRFSLWSIDSYLPMSYRYLMYAPTVPDDCFADGVGHIYYTGSKEEYLAEEKKVEDDVMAVINSVVKPEYTDFEKALALYDWITSHCYYDEEPDEEHPLSIEGVLYGHRGICTDFAQFYTLALRQCGVDAFEVSDNGHKWTYVVIDGKGYHSDPTWALKNTDDTLAGKDGPLMLDYFLMTDDERSYTRETDPEEWKLSTVGLVRDYKESGITAEDEKFLRLRGHTLAGIDRQSKILRLENIDGEISEFPYE